MKKDPKTAAIEALLEMNSMVQKRSTKFSYSNEKECYKKIEWTILSGRGAIIKVAMDHEEKAILFEDEIEWSTIQKRSIKQNIF